MQSTHGTREMLLDKFNHIADFTKVEGTPPRPAVYLKDWKCSFFAMAQEGVIPLSDNGISVQRWQAVVLVYDKAKVPRRGDQIENLRLYRTRELVKKKLTIVDVVPYRIDKTYMLLLTESADR